MRGNKNETERVGFRAGGLVAAVGAVMMLLAIGTMGWGGGGNSGVTPFAGVWVANNSVPPTALHSPGADFALGGTFRVPADPAARQALVAPQDTLFDSNNNLWIVDGGNGAGTGSAVYRFLFNQIISLNHDFEPGSNFVLKALLRTGPPSSFRSLRLLTPPATCGSAILRPT